MTLQKKLDWLRETLALGNNITDYRMMQINRMCIEIAVTIAKSDLLDRLSNTPVLDRDQATDNEIILNEFVGQARELLQTECKE